MTAKVVGDPYAAHAAAQLRRGPRKAADALAYYDRSIALVEATIEADAPLAPHYPPAGDSLERRLDDLRRRRAALAAALAAAKRCVKCGAPLTDKTQPGYAESVGPDCYRKVHAQ